MESELVTRVLTALYVFTVPAVTTVGYLPQVLKLARTKQAEGLSLGSWVLWILSSLVSVLYVSLVVDDLALLVVSVMHLVFCATISAQILWYRGARSEGGG
ncbi:MAG: PQ-loop domain-containing transporter [Nannocystaceae bacterium]